MANLYTNDIKTDSYVNVETTTGLSFVADTVYTLQSLDNDFYIREGSTGDGFYVKALEKVEFKAGTDDLYLKPAVWGRVRLNIAS